VEQLVELLRGRPRVRFPMGSLEFLKLFFNSFGRNVGLESTPASNGNDYQGYLLAGKGGRCMVLPNLSPSSLQITNLTHIFFMYVYFYFLHVSGSHVPIIRRIV
jgi:hypothetical protein